MASQDFQPAPNVLFLEKLNVWCSIGCSGPLALYVYNENTHWRYLLRSRTSTASRTKELYADSTQNWQLMRENASFHTSKTVSAFMTKEGIQTLIWPRNSPDANRVENVWPILRMMVAEKEPHSLELENACINLGTNSLQR